MVTFPVGNAKVCDPDFDTLPLMKLVVPAPEQPALSPNKMALVPVEIIPPLNFNESLIERFVVSGMFMPVLSSSRVPSIAGTLKFIETGCVPLKRKLELLLPSIKPAP